LLDDCRVQCHAPLGNSRAGDIQFFITGIGGNSANNFVATLNFSDATTTALQFSVADWSGNRDYNATEKIPRATELVPAPLWIAPSPALFMIKSEGA